MTLINGRAYLQPELLDSGTPVLRIQNLNGGDRWYYSNLTLPENKYCENGDLLFAWSATFGPYNYSGPKSIYHYHIWKVLPKKNVTDRGYAYYVLMHITQKVKDEAHGISMLHITKSGMEALQIPLPPLTTQKRIAAILDAADLYRQTTKALVAKYDQLAQSLFLEMFGDPVNNQNNWEIKKFSDVGKLDRGKSKHRPRNAPELLGGKYPLIQTGDVANSEGYITTFKSTYSDFGLKQSKIWKAGTLCITIAANIAKTGILTFDACFPDSVVGFIPNARTNAEFVQHWMSFLQKILEDSAPESAQKNINLEILRNLDIIVPPETLQSQFSDRINIILQQKHQALAVLQKSETLFNSLLQKAFKGELVAE